MLLLNNTLRYLSSTKYYGIIYQHNDGDSLASVLDATMRHPLTDGPPQGTYTYSSTRLLSGPPKSKVQWHSARVELNIMQPAMLCWKSNGSGV